MNKYPLHPVLIVDDEPQVMQGIDVALKTSGITNTLSCTNSLEAMGLIARHQPDVILLDLAMPHIGGEEILAKASLAFPDIPVIVVTSTDELETAVRCMKTGAFDYMLKPITKERLISGVRRAIELRELRRENEELKHHVLSGEVEHAEAFAAFDCVSAKMRSLFRYVESIAVSQEPVLITGETGVGKEIMAGCIHRLSCPRSPFVPVNVAGLDENAFSDTLFGHRKGAFTGAHDVRGGLIEKANGGVLFLDEIGDLDAGMQVKLLRLLQEREYLPLGSDMAKRSTARVIVATNKSLEELRDSGKFRADLFFRLRHHHVHIPPLRERPEDLPRLTGRILDLACERLKKKRPEVPANLLPLLASYPFPGNVRELEAMIHDALTQHKSGVLSLQTFRKWIGHTDPAASAGTMHAGSSSDPTSLFTGKFPSLKEASEHLIAEAMRRADGNQATAAGMLGITRQALNRRLRTRKK